MLQRLGGRMRHHPQDRRRRFTDQMRQVVTHAKDEARQLGHDHVGTEHLLLGLLRTGDDGLASACLGLQGISLAAVCAQVEQTSSPGGSLLPQHLALTPRAKTALDLALREALQLGHDYVGGEHLLLGLIQQGEGAAVQALVELGADPPALRQKLLDELGADPQLVELLAAYSLIVSQDPAS
jgi:ATP-dependent Clp protease ATP-binding subunit ClpC